MIQAERYLRTVTSSDSSHLLKNYRALKAIKDQRWTSCQI